MRAPEQQERRAKLSALKLCINGPLPGAQRRRPSTVVHGPVVRGGKCQHCLDVHKKTDTGSARMYRFYRQEVEK